MQMDTLFLIIKFIDYGFQILSTIRFFSSLNAHFGAFHYVVNTWNDNKA